MTRVSKRIIAWFLVLTTVIGLLFTVSSVTYAASSEDALGRLKGYVRKGTLYTGKMKVSGAPYKNLSNTHYKISGGGYWTYGELVGGSSVQGKSSSDLVSEDVIDTLKYKDLTAGSKQAFLKDIFRIANAASYYGISDITDETVTDLYNEMQNYDGMGSQLMASLLSETKPDYATANRIYKPFSGIIGTILGLLSVIVMALLGVTMALDLVYINIPAAQLVLGSEKDGSGSGNGATKFAAKLVSAEAQKAVEATQNDGQNGEYKGANGVYFKYRWKGLVLLGICLLYLVQGQIWSFVAWLIDLFSGFLGF